VGGKNSSSSCSGKGWKLKASLLESNIYIFIIEPSPEKWQVAVERVEEARRTRPPLSLFLMSVKGKILPKVKKGGRVSEKRRKRLYSGGAYETTRRRLPVFAKEETDTEEEHMDLYIRPPAVDARESMKVLLVDRGRKLPGECEP